MEINDNRFVAKKLLFSNNARQHFQNIFLQTTVGYYLWV